MTAATGGRMTDLPRTALDRAMRSVLAQLELVSNGTTTSYNAAGGAGGDNPDPRPRGGDGAPHLYWRREYGPPFALSTTKYPGARNDEARADTLQRATDDLEQITGRGTASVVRPAGETVEQRNARIAAEGEGYTIKEAAIRFRCGERDIRRARINAGLDPYYGKKPVAEPATGSTVRRERAIALRAEGYSVTSIALLLKVDKATISRDLRKAA